MAGKLSEDLGGTALGGSRRGSGFDGKRRDLPRRDDEWGVRESVKHGGVGIFEETPQSVYTVKNGVGKMSKSVLTVYRFGAKIDAMREKVHLRIHKGLKIYAYEENDDFAGTPRRRWRT
ncbi:MAG: hypothetical protein PUJ57_02670 [Peptoniphilaceae bacterium]|nr:hypothetical protein [Peptoniphilaceae bacterium]MDY6086208.1 hypothetical protein [Peptoniphilaceae bacterium]